MKTFLIQTVADQIVHDFAFHLIYAIKYNNWFRNDQIFDYVLSESTDQPNCIPVGNLDFVFAYTEKHFGLSKKDFPPINIPMELFRIDYLRRYCRVADSRSFEFDHEYFVKSATEYKGFTGIYSKSSDVPDGMYLFSDVINITSEWRAFVFQGTLVGINNYSGDFGVFPRMSVVYRMIESYRHCPPAYTLDVGINDFGTFLIEVHPFVSCGLYGFQDYRILPQMFSSAFEYFIKR